MQIGVLDLDVRTVAPCQAGARAAEQAGFDTYWLAGGWRDPVTLATAAGCVVPRIEIGTAINSIWGMHPLAMAEQALTVNDALQGRFVLGLGVSHPHMVLERFGRPYERPVRFLREFLTILMTAMGQGKVDFTGEMLACHTELRLQNMRRPKVLIAALGPQSVAVAGRWADGTLTFMVPLPALESMTIPTATAAAREAGRPRPFFLAQAPICVTCNEEAARAHIGKQFERYGNGYYPAYKASLDRSGISGGPGSVAVVGTEEEVARELSRYRDIGIDQFMGVVSGTPEEQERTMKFIAQLSDCNARKKP